MQCDSDPGTPPTTAHRRLVMPPLRNPLPRHKALKPGDQKSLQSAALYIEAYAIWQRKAMVEGIDSLLLERPIPMGASLSKYWVMKKGCALLRLNLVHGDFVWCLEGECTNSNVDYDTMFDNLKHLRSVEYPPPTTQKWISTKHGKH
jgi:hypothetical protein